MKKELKGSTKEAIAAYLFLIPNFLGFLAFTSIPVVVSFALGFVKWDLLSAPQFVGLENFKALIFVPETAPPMLYRVSRILDGVIAWKRLPNSPIESE